jgi:tRNA pseudouridine38-40 synthase
MRYFLEVSYKGTNYSGFQAQKNANTVQAEMEKALLILLKQEISLTGSSRTDAGVHAMQNYFHFDTIIPLLLWKEENSERRFLYNLNAILPGDIVVKKLIPVSANAHCRFDAVSREYNYFIYRDKNPFLKDRGFYFPYKLDLEKMKEAAATIKGYSDFTSFSKKKTQVKTFDCTIYESEWLLENDCLVYHVKANRFLRGMVRALTATMLKLGRGKIELSDFKLLIEAKDCSKASFAVPAHGLFLIAVYYPEEYFKQ